MRYLPAHLALAGLSVTAAGAQPLYHLDEPPADAPAAVASATAGGSPEPGLPAVSHPVRLDLDLLRDGPALLAFPTPEAETFWAVRDRFENHGDGAVTWSGRDPGSDYNAVLLTLRDGRLLGSFNHGDDEWTILGSPAGAKIQRVVRGTAPATASCNATVPPVPVLPFEADRPAVAAAPATVRAASTPKVVQDILVLYTEEARQYVEDWSKDRWGNWKRPVYDGYTISDLIHYANQVTNEVYSNSDIPATTNIVGIERMPDCDTCPDPGVGYTWGEDTIDVQTEDGAVKKLRAKYNADIVYAYIFDTGLSCGYAWTRVKGQVDRDFAEYSHALTNLYCDSPWWYPKTYGKNWLIPYYETMAHEVGHVHGAFHDPASRSPGDTSVAMVPWAYGYIDSASSKKTVMANSSSAQHVNYYSTTRVTPNGWTLGKVNEAENERLVRSMAQTVATYGDYAVPPAKPTIRSVEDSYQAGAVIIYWNDNADNETHYEIRYRRAGQQWENAAWNAAHDRKTDQTKAFIDGLERGKRYTFRVFAVNGYGKTGSERVYHRPR